MEKAWRALTPDNVAALGGELGVYQLADEKEQILRIGFAGGRSLFGLRGELLKALEERHGHSVFFRIEINCQYQSRYEELLMVHKADHGSLPAGNAFENRRKIGRLSIG
tara:strand:+ start:35743 stop:36069 length:327 start_codon:yes stop_codon:yes gene_type:complete